MKLSGTVQKTIRLEADSFLRLAKIAEASKMASQNELISHLLDLGMDAYEEMEIDSEIEKERVPAKTDIETMEEDTNKAVSGEKESETVTLESKQATVEICPFTGEPKKNTYGLGPEDEFAL